MKSWQGLIKTTEILAKILYGTYYLILSYSIDCNTAIFFANRFERSLNARSGASHRYTTVNDFYLNKGSILTSKFVHLLHLKRSYFMFRSVAGAMSSPPSTCQVMSGSLSSPSSACQVMSSPPSSLQVMSPSSSVLISSPPPPGITCSTVSEGL